MKKLTLILSLMVMAFTTSCQKDDEVGGTVESRAIGKWTVVGYSIGNDKQTITNCFKKGILEINSDGTFKRTTFTNEDDCDTDTERTGTGTYTYDKTTDDFLFYYNGSTEPKVADMTTIYNADEMTFLERPTQGTGTVVAVYEYIRN